MRASSWLRARPFGMDISRDGLTWLNSRFLGSVASSSTSGGGTGNDIGVTPTETNTPSTTPSPKPGSAEDLLNFLQIHRKEWKSKPGYSRRTRSKDSSHLQQRPDHQQQHEQLLHPFPNRPFPPSSGPYNQQNTYQKPQWKKNPNQIKSASALGLSHPRRSGEITSRVVAAFANADAQLRSQDLSKEDKLDAAHRCILSFTRLSNFPLSDINISAIMHRVCRLVTHRGLGDTRIWTAGSAAGASYSTLGHEELMHKLLQDLVSRAKEQLLLQPPTPPPPRPALSASKARTGERRHNNRRRESTVPPVSRIKPTSPPLTGSGAAMGTAAKGVPVTATGTAAGVYTKVYESTAALALHSCGAIGMKISQEDLDILASTLLTFQHLWTEQRISMVLLALSRLGIIHKAVPSHSAVNDLLDALYSTAEEKIPHFSAEELSTIVWSLANIEYEKINSMFLTEVMAALLPKIDQLPIVGVYSILEGLMMHEWVAPAPKNAWEEVYNPTETGSTELTILKLEKNSGGGGGGLFYNFNKKSSPRSDGFGGSSSSTKRHRQMESSSEAEGRFQVKDLRELQSLAKAWELQRRSGLAEFLKQQQQQQHGGGGGGSSGHESISSASSSSSVFQIAGGDHRGLDALAQSAMKTRAQRASKAQLSEIAARVARELRASVAAAAPGINSVDDDSVSSVEDEEKAVVFASEEDADALVERLLTGAWPVYDNEKERKKNDDGFKFVEKVNGQHHEYINNPNQQQNNDSTIKMDSTTIINSTTSTNGTGTGKGRRRIFRLGPLLAEASINPSSGQEIIQPHYERSHLWDPLLLHPSQQAAFVDRNENYDDDNLGKKLEKEGGREKQVDQLNSEYHLLHLEKDDVDGSHGLNIENISENNDSSDLSATSSTAVTDATSEAAASAIAALARHVTEAMIPDARPDQAVSFARYFSALRHYDRDLLLAVKNKVEEALEKYNSPDLVNNTEYSTATATTSSSLDSTSPSSLNTTPLPTQTTVPMSVTAISNFLWSFASLGVTDLIPLELSRKVMHAALSDTGWEYSTVALSRAAWSLAVLGHLDAATLKEICARIVASQNKNLAKNMKNDTANSTISSNSTSSNIRESSSNHVAMKQLFQAALQVEISTGVSHQTLLPEELRSTAAAAWNDRRNFLSTSYLQRQVAGSLGNLGLECELEHVPEESFVVIDIAAFTRKDKNKHDMAENGSSVSKVAVEVDGPYHFATNKITHKLGAMQLRDSLLRHSGWNVVTVPYYEWMHVKPWEREIYLEGKVMPVLYEDVQEG